MLYNILYNLLVGVGVLVVAGITILTFQLIIIGIRELWYQWKDYKRPY